MSDPTDTFTNQASHESPPIGRVLAIDLGRKRVGLAISDELGLTARPLQRLERTSWKKLVRDLADLARSFDVSRLVIGLPLRLDGTEGEAAADVRRVAENLRLSLGLPVYLQDERLTSKDSEEHLRRQGRGEREVLELVDSESAKIILQEFLSENNF
jgi:putative holliday junction resolvase